MSTASELADRSGALSSALGEASARVDELTAEVSAEEIATQAALVAGDFEAAEASRNRAQAARVQIPAAEAARDALLRAEREVSAARQVAERREHRDELRDTVEATRMELERSVAAARDHVREARTSILAAHALEGQYVSMQRELLDVEFALGERVHSLTHRFDRPATRATGELANPIGGWAGAPDDRILLRLVHLTEKNLGRAEL